MESLMQYVWQHRLWQQSNLRTVDGEVVQIIDPGTLNTNSGPDFFNAKIAIDGHLWAGDVEIHVKASDWHRHGHDNDPAYESVILHVVGRDDTVIRRSDGSPIPQMRMPCSPQFSRCYSALVDSSQSSLPCASFIRSMSSLHMRDWLDSLAYERLYDKAERIRQILERHSGDWENACYVTLARGLGFGINAEPFERLALALPLRFLGKHSDSPAAVEALLFGQAGLLENAPLSDPYVARLSEEYRFLTHKFDLHRPEAMGWKMSRMRPANFPHRRIAALAAIITGGFRMLSDILAIRSVDRAATLLSRPLPDYWHHHYTFGAASSRSSESTLSRSSIQRLCINVVAPLQFAYGLTHGLQEMQDNALNLLNSIPAENNSVIRPLLDANLPASSAFDSQALIQLRKAYCLQRKCLYCKLGHRLLSRQATAPHQL